MKINRPLIEKVILYRTMMKQDPVLKFATRNKASPINVFGKYQPYSEEAFKTVYNSNIDAVKLRFKHTTLIINGRHKST